MTEPTAPASDPPVGGVTRRGLLGLAAATTAVTALAACRGSDSEVPPADAADESDPSGEKTDSETADSAASQALAKVADVPVGSGVILTDPKMVVTQPAEGQFKGFSSICTHQSCPVTSIKGKTISCACHGSAFNVADGSVVNGPATRPLREIKVKVDGDSIVKA